MNHQYPDNNILKIAKTKVFSFYQQFVDHRREKYLNKVKKRLHKRRKRKLRKSPTIYYASRMWSGYSKISVQAMETIFHDLSQFDLVRADAAMNLAYRKFFERDFHAVCLLLEQSEKLDPEKNQKRSLAYLQALIATDRIIDAKIKLSVVRREYPFMPEWDALESVIEKKMTINAGFSPEEVGIRQLEPLNRIFENVGLAILRRKDSSKLPAMNNICCDVGVIPDAAQLPLISVIMPAYNAASTITFSLESLTCQTYSNIEIIVVDDCSADNTVSVVAGIMAKDSRIKLVSKNKNEGAYAARNDGLALAQGEYITVHDADDWNHPQKLEISYQLVRDNEKAVASMLYHLLVDEFLECLPHWKPAETLFKLDFTSLLFRRDVIQQVGGWDNVRVGADSALVLRIESIYGQQAIVRGPQSHPYMLCYGRENSLTRTKATHISTFSFGLRQQYRDVVRYLCKKNIYQIDNCPGLIPLGNRISKSPVKYDWLVLFDFSRDDKYAASVLAALRRAAKSGRNLAAMSWHSIEYKAPKHLADNFYDLCIECNIDLVSPGDLLRVERLVIGCGSLLDCMLDDYPVIECNKSVILTANMIEEQRLLCARIQSLLGDKIEQIVVGSSFGAEIDVKIAAV